MKLQTRTDEEPELNLTSLIDVVFLLLIFFMVTTTFERQALVEIELPEASAEPENISSPPLELVISSDGRYFLGNNEVLNTRVDTLIEALEQAVTGDERPPLTIRGDRRTQLQAFVIAMDAAAQAGFGNVSIATTPGDTGSG